MAVYTNPLGLLYAEIDSAGSLKLAGDRVLYGARKSSEAETEWLTRQKVAQCLETIASIVHERGGIVASTAGDQIFCNLPNANAAVDAARAIQQSQAEAAAEAQPENSESPLSAPLGIRIALHFGPLLVDAGRLSGEALELARAILKHADSDQILASADIVDALHDGSAEELQDLGETTVDGSLPKVRLHEVVWIDETHAPVRTPSAYDQDPETSSLASPSVELASEAPAETPVAPAAPSPPPVPLPDIPAANEPQEPQPELTLRFKGKKLTLNRDHPTLMLRSGKERKEHAKIRLDGDKFILENLNVTGTHVRRKDGREELCLEQLDLIEHGAVSLGNDFSQASQVIQYVAS